MRLPNFVAAAALPAPAITNHAAANRRTARNTLHPAAAIYQDGRFVCYGEVTGNGYINCYPMGGGGEPFCRPTCGPCQADSDSPTGRSRFCLRRNCDDYTRPC